MYKNYYIYRLIMIIVLIFYSLEPEETVRRLIPFEACLQQFCSDEIVSGYMKSISAVIISAHHLSYYQTP